jgi:hypothetical protein
MALGGRSPKSRVIAVIAVIGAESTVQGSPVVFPNKSNLAIFR